MTRYEREKAKLADCREKGISHQSYLADAIERGAKAMGTVQVAEYAGKIDAAINQANADMARVIHTDNGAVSNNRNLDGFIAEQHHASTFNIDAAAKGKDFTAAAQESHGKDSVDLFIDDARGHHVRRYQSKYGKDSETTEQYFEDGDYRGQRKLVPKGQGKDIKGANEEIEFQGVKSKPLSKEEAKELQRQAQEAHEIKQYEWNDVNKAAIAKGIGQKAGVAAVAAVGFQGARILGRRIWNAATGQENNSVEEDVGEFVESALQSGASAGLTVAAAGGVTVAARNGFLGSVLKSTPVGTIANAVAIGVEHVKTLYHFAKGDITGEQAVDRVGDATCSMVGSLACVGKGVAIGGALGSVLGPVGSAVGGVVGGVVGGIAGSTIGHAVWEGGKAIVKTAAKAVHAVASGIGHVVSGIGHAIGGIFRGIGSLFGW